MPVPRRAQTPKSELVEEISHLFRVNGYFGTTMSVISGRTGLGRSSIYHHFADGKLEMAQNSLDLIEAFIATMERVAQAEDVALTERWALIERMLRTHYRDGELGCLLAIFALEDVPGELRDRTKALLDSWLIVMARLHRSAGASDLDGPRCAQRDVAAIQGGLVLSRGQSSNKPFDQALLCVAEGFS